MLTHIDRQPQSVCWCVYVWVVAMFCLPLYFVFIVTLTAIFLHKVLFSSTASLSVSISISLALFATVLFAVAFATFCLPQ